jgi:eukaryotic-like serine/threonine-protein kinase
MTPERWRQIREVFDAAALLPAEELPAFLSARCGSDTDLRVEVDSLLRADRSAGLRAPHAAEEVAPELATSEETAGAPVPQRIGPYRVVSEIGRGGMGTVLLAERADGDFEHKVAIKLVRRGLGSDAIVRRFRAERQILAGLDHPGIARLFDGGTTEEGLPYLVMEHVAGENLLAYCARRSLPIDERLRIFRRVCAAVRYAHQHLVVHRDLKPSNILVTGDGEPKLLDFGIAKLLHPQLTGEPAEATVTTLRWMTPEYASPEQIRGEPVTTRADVYALGIVLYELLTGARPYRLRTHAPGELEAAVLDQEPARPSSVVRGGELQHRLRRDLDSIVLKALAKDPGRRYDGAGELDDDLRRHLDGLPVEARPASAAYRTRKFVGRHRWGVAAAVAVLLGLTALGSYHEARLRRERDRALLESERARQVSGFLSALFDGADPNRTRGAALTAREILQEAGRRLDRAPLRPEVKAELLQMVGETYGRLALASEAEPPLAAALALREAALGPAHADTGRTLFALGTLRLQSDDPQSAEATLSRAIAVLEGALGPDAPELASARDRFAMAAAARDPAEAYRRERRALEVQVRSGAPLYDRANIYNNMGYAAHALGRERHAAWLYELAYRDYVAARGDSSPAAANALCNAAFLVGASGDLERGVAMSRRAQAIHERAWGRDHQQLAGCLRTGGGLLRQLGDLPAAREMTARGLAMMRRLFGEDDSRTVGLARMLGEIAADEGELDEAAALHARWLAFHDKYGSGETDAWAASLTALARADLARGRRAEAEPRLRRALALQRRDHQPVDDVLVSTLTALGELLAAERGARGDEGRRLLVEAVSLAERDLRPTNSRRRAAELALARFDDAATPDARTPRRAGSS